VSFVVVGRMILGNSLDRSAVSTDATYRLIPVGIGIWDEITVHLMCFGFLLWRRWGSSCGYGRRRGVGLGDRFGLRLGV
jgi:hypothetical protein